MIKKAIIESALGRTVTNVDDFGLRNYIATDVADGAGLLQNIQALYCSPNGRGFVSFRY